MIKAWCEECEATGNIECHNGCCMIECTHCDSKGYTEHDGTLEDLELAQATKLAFENQHIPFTKITELIKWYRLQKDGKNENTPSK